MGIMLALPACKDFDKTGTVDGRNNACPRQSETLNRPGVGNEARTDALDAEHGFSPAQGRKQDQLICWINDKVANPAYLHFAVRKALGRSLSSAIQRSVMSAAITGAAFYALLIKQ